MSHFSGQHRGPRSPWGQVMMHGQAMPHRGIFIPLDTDGDGKITKEEVLKLYAMVDKDGDGSVTREDFIKGMIAASKAKSASDKATTPNAARDAASKQDNQPSGDATRRRDVPIPGRHGDGHFGTGGPNRPSFFGPPAASMLMNRFDKAQKGKLTKDDVPAPLWDRISKADANDDGSVTKDELETYFKNRRPGAPGADSPSRPDQKHETDQIKPESEKPKDQKPDEAKPQAQLTDPDKPADATSAANVVVAS